MEIVGFYISASLIGFLAVVLILATVGGIYFPVLEAPFYLDDHHLLSHLPVWEGWDSLSSIWAYDPSRFLSHLSFALSYRAHVMEPAGYYWVNLVLHFANGAVLFLFLMWLTTRLSVLGQQRERFPFSLILVSVLVFLAHPLQSSAVSYIAQRSALLATFFYLSAAACYLKGRSSEFTGHYFIFAVIAAILGSLCKPILFSLPLTLLVMEILFFPGDLKKVGSLLGRLLPFVLIAACIPVLLAMWKHGGSPTVDGILSMSRETVDFSRKDYFLTQGNVLVTYLMMVLYPLEQGMDRHFVLATSFFQGTTPFAFAALGMIFFFGVWMIFVNRLVAFGIFWFFITVGLESSVFPLKDVIFEHRMYLPMAGLCWLVPAGAYAVIRRKPFYLILMLMWVAGLGWLTYHRNVVMSRPLVFLREEVRMSPLKPRPRLNLGMAYFKEGMWDLAEAEFRRVIELVPDHAKALSNLSMIAFQKGNDDEALIMAEKAVEADESLAEGYINRGNVHLRRKNTEAALEDYEQALNLNPRSPEALHNRGLALSERGHPDLALIDFEQAISIRPDLPDAWRNKGNALRALGRDDEAIRAYVSALTINRSDARTHFHLGQLYRRNGQEDRALDHFNEALITDPEMSPARRNRAEIYLKREAIDLALRELDIYLSVETGDAEAYFLRSLAHKSRGEYTRAMEDYLMAQRYGFPTKIQYLRELKFLLKSSGSSR